MAPFIPERNQVFLSFCLAFSSFQRISYCMRRYLSYFHLQKRQGLLKIPDIYLNSFLFSTHLILVLANLYYIGLSNLIGSLLALHFNFTMLITINSSDFTIIQLRFQCIDLNKLCNSVKKVLTMSLKFSYIFSRPSTEIYFLKSNPSDTQGEVKSKNSTNNHFFLLRYNRI